MRTVTPSPEDEQITRNILRTFDPLFSSLVAASVFMHVCAAIWLRLLAPAPEPTLEELEPRFQRVFFEPSFNKAVKRPPPVVTQVKRPEPTATEKPVPRSEIPKRVVGMGLLSAVGRNGAIGSVFAPDGVTENLHAMLQDARGVQLAGPAVPDSVRSDDAKDVGVLDVRTLGPRVPGARRDPTHQNAALASQVHIRPIDPSPSDDKNVILRAIRARISGIKACYENALKRSPTLKGKIVMHFVVGEDGRVKVAEAEENALGSDEVATCISSLIKRIRFEPGDNELEASFPFVFLPTE